MDNLEKVEVEKLIPAMPSIPSFSSIQDWVGENLLAIILVILLAVYIFYSYGQKKVSLASGYKSFLDRISDGINRMFGKFWLSSNMEGKAIKTRVRFNEEENEEYEDERAEERRSVMYI
jgi:hypothetical protein